LMDTWRDLQEAGRRPVLMEDNAPAHSGKYSVLTRAELGIEKLAHPPYSPDLMS